MMTPRLNGRTLRKAIIAASRPARDGTRRTSSKDMRQTRLLKISQETRSVRKPMHHINATEMVGATESATLPGSKSVTRSPCCTNCNRTEGHELLISGQLHLATSQLPIHVLFDTGCMQTNVISVRIAAVKREGGEIQKVSVTLTWVPKAIIWCGVSNERHYIVDI